MLASEVLLEQLQRVPQSQQASLVHALDPQVPQEPPEKDQAEQVRLRLQPVELLGADPVDQCRLLLLLLQDGDLVRRRPTF